LVQSIHPTKIKIIDTIWDNTLTTGGIVLADETNKALKAIGDDSDWLIYIQGDEVFHEADYVVIKNAMEQYKEDERVDGLLFKYRHFYGSYDYVATSSRWYKNEIRIIKNNKSIYSYKDAQGFRKGNNEKLNVKAIDAYVHHYGWVKEPKIMNEKIVNTGSIWGGTDYTEEHIERALQQEFNYSGIDILEKFRGTHPLIFTTRVASINWKFNYELSFNKLTFKDKIKNFVEKITGKRFFDYQNYKII
jgi:hypothetical protein